MQLNREKPWFENVVKGDKYRDDKKLEIYLTNRVPLHTKTQIGKFKTIPSFQGERQAVKKLHDRANKDFHIKSNKPPIWESENWWAMRVPDDEVLPRKRPYFHMTREGYSDPMARHPKWKNIRIPLDVRYPPNDNMPQPKYNADQIDKLNALYYSQYNMQPYKNKMKKAEPLWKNNAERAGSGIEETEMSEKQKNIIIDKHKDIPVGLHGKTEPADELIKRLRAEKNIDQERRFKEQVWRPKDYYKSSLIYAMTNRRILGINWDSQKSKDNAQIEKWRDANRIHPDDDRIKSMKEKLEARTKVYNDRKDQIIIALRAISYAMRKKKNMKDADKNAAGQMKKLHGTYHPEHVMIRRAARAENRKETKKSRKAKKNIGGAVKHA